MVQQEARYLQITRSPKITFESLCVVAKIAQMQLVIPPPSKISHLPNLFQKGIVFCMAEIARRINFASSSSPPHKAPNFRGRPIISTSFFTRTCLLRRTWPRALLTSTGRTRTRTLTSRTVPITPLRRHDAMSSRRYAAAARCVSFETLIDSRRIGARDSKRACPLGRFPRAAYRETQLSRRRNAALASFPSEQPPLEVSG